MSAPAFEGYLALDEATPAEQTLIEIVPSDYDADAVFEIYSIWLDSYLLSANFDIKIYQKIDGSTYQEIPAYAQAGLFFNSAFNILRDHGPIQFCQALKVTAQSAGGGGGAANLIYSIPYRLFIAENIWAEYIQADNNVDGEMSMPAWKLLGGVFAALRKKMFYYSP